MTDASEQLPLFFINCVAFCNHFNKLNFQNVAASAVSLTVLSLLLYMLAYPLAGRERGRA